MVKVELRGLKIARARGKYYVYRRADGACLLKGFVGSLAALRTRLGAPDMLGLYNVGRARIAYPERSLGWLVAWFTDPEKCQEFKDLAEVTRNEYKAGLGFLEPLYDTPLASISSPDVYAARDKASQDKWPAFADKMVTALSTMFTLAVQRGWMASNPALGVKRIYKPDPNANREWRPEEWEAVFPRAPMALQIAYMLARYVGYRSQSIVRVGWSNYKPDRQFGMCFRMAHKKNSERHWIPAAPVLQDFLAALTETSPCIAVRFNGEAWDSEEQLQKQSSNFLASLRRQGITAPGLTLHGLRATFAADIKRVTGANDDQIAAALGDRDTRMGAHYTRHVEQESKIIYLFASETMRTRTEQDLENRRAQNGKPPKKRSNIRRLKTKGGL